MSRSAPRPLRRLLTRFAGNTAGVAAVEFALILPFLLTLYLGSIEASSLYTVDRRVEVISSTVADLVARWNPNEGTIPTNTLDDYFKAAEAILTPYSPTGMTQVVSVLQVSSAGLAKVVWSCSYNGGTSLPKDSTYTLGTD
ncbi:MAG: pilus assembly protein, partial [Alphaproteobacteria bacterium]|nr:pilus assembly protein [Alphaproteobacteria bacterium]